MLKQHVRFEYEKLNINVDSDLFFKDSPIDFI